MIAYLEAENAYTEARTAATSPCATPSSPRSRPGPRRPTSACRATRPTAAGARYWYYARTVEGSEYAIYCRAPAPDRAHPAGRRGRDRGRADPAGRQRRGGRARVLLPRRVQHLHRRTAAGVLGRRRRATSGSPCWSRTCRPARCARTGSPTPRTGWPGPRNDHLFYTRADAGLAAVRGAAAPARHRPGHRRRGAHRARRAVLARGRDQPGRGVDAASRRAASSPRSTGCCPPPTRRASRGSWRRAARAWSTTSSRPATGC